MKFNGSDTPGVCFPTSVNRGMVTGTKCGVATTIMRTSVWTPDVTCEGCLAAMAAGRVRIDAMLATRAALNVPGSGARSTVQG